jgi:hypothetical protein
MTTTIRTALLSALVLSLTCGFATVGDLTTGTRGANSPTADVASQSHGGVRQPQLMVKCKDPIECSKGRA